MNPTVQKDKLRHLLRKERRQIKRDMWRLINEGVCLNLTILLEKLVFKRVFSYVATPEEVDPMSALTNFMPVGLPRVLEARHMEFYPWEVGMTLKENRYGILEPSPKDANSVWSARAGDIMLIPCLALAEDGTRLGFGGGFYDTYLEKAASGVIKVGICLAQAMREELPSEPHDIKLNWGVSETCVKPLNGGEA